jgi:hypothetical protein
MLGQNTLGFGCVRISKCFPNGFRPNVPNLTHSVLTRQYQQKLGNTPKPHKTTILHSTFSAYLTNYYSMLY